MLSNYLKTSLRNLRRNKTYATINILGLALGMACGLLIFMLVKYHLSFDDFHADSDRIYRIVTEQHRDVISYTPGVPSPLGKAFRADYDFAEKVARIASEEDMTITVKDGDKIELFKEEGGVAIVESEYFDIFNFPLVLGNMKTALVEPNTAIITERLAKKYFGDQNPINKTFQFGDKIDAKITGILKDFPKNTDQKTEIFVSYPTLKQYNEWLAGDDAWGGITSGMRCYVRLRPQVAVAQVEKVFPAYVTKYRPTSTNVHHYKLQPLDDVHFNADYGGPMSKRNLWVLSFIGIFLIVTACVNFINLATAQALNRAKEVGMRKVLGSLRGQLFWQFIAQTAVITILALLLAVVLTVVVLPYVNIWFSSEVSFNILNDWQLLLFIPALVLLVTFLAGSYPGLILAGFQPVVALKGKLSQQHIGGFNTRRALIVTQFALSQALVIGMIVIAKQMSFSVNSDLGFDKDAVVTVPIAADYQKGKTMQGELEQLAGVESVTMCFATPASNNSNWNTTPYYDNDPKEQEFRVSVKAADANYLETFGLELVAGRNVFPSDSAREMIVNEAFARKLNLKAPEELLGKTLVVSNGDNKGLIVGVVKDFHDLSFHEEINPIAIFTNPGLYNTYAIKLNAADLTTTMAAIEKAWKESHPGQLYSYEFLDDDIASFYETEALMLKLIQTFSALALFIGCLGLYGLVSFMAAQKTKEIGIRKVLGSSIAQILWIFGKEFGRLILIAFVIAAPLAWWLMRNWLADFEFQAKFGAGVFIWALLGTFFVAFATVSYQAVRAALMNPVTSLRSE
ncbi:ABC transporter permease [Persicitalea jodogahamensis]|uniref:ABC transporter permease n=1 Tax=Persicitalea jodogahamensis TaxID=402147 RepID=A0A8J3D751_9BACT|nr:ABC transporter permease [Persicitalea jodogahamensis]GHB83718.1 ABC transporter permease [Persicitalea jodogahamensis]